MDLAVYLDSVIPLTGPRAGCEVGRRWAGQITLTGPGDESDKGICR